ncbi:MAG: outer membrane lipoprotein carrier protein LolA [Candidatus Brocadiales bacterium]
MRHNPSLSPFLLIIATVLTSCATMEHVFIGPPKVLTIEEVRDGVTSNSKKISTLKAKAKITLMSRDLKDPLVCKGYIRLERPKRLRIICSKLFSTIFDVLSDGHEFWLYVPKEKRLYRGLSTQDITYLGLKFSPNDVASIFEIGEAFQDTTVTSFEVHPEHWHIQLTNPQELTEHHLMVERHNLHVIRYDSYNPDGSLKMKALLDDYRDVDGCHVPQRIEIYWPRGDTKLILQLKGLSLNEELDPKIFRFTTPENAEIIRLSKRREPSYLELDGIIPTSQLMSTAYGSTIYGVLSLTSPAAVL